MGICMIVLDVAIIHYPIAYEVYPRNTLQLDLP